MVPFTAVTRTSYYAIILGSQTQLDMWASMKKYANYNAAFISTNDKMHHFE